MKKTLQLLLVLNCLSVSLSAQNTNLLQLWQTKDWTKLIDASDAEIDLNKSNYQAYYWKQYALLEQGKHKEAIEVLKTAFQFCSNKLEIRSELANLYFSRSMFLQAKVELDTLLKEEKLQLRTVKQRVLIHEFSKERLAAINLLHKAVNQDATKAFYWIHLGDNYKQLGEFDKAIEYYETAVGLNPLDYETNSKLAYVYLSVDPDASLDICETVLEKDATNIRFIQTAASAHVKLEELADALSYYEKAMQLGDSTLNTIRNAGILYQKTNKQDKAIQLLAKAYQADSTDMKVMYYLAVAETHFLNVDRGLELFDKCLQLMEPDSAIVSIIHKEKAAIFKDKKEHQLALDHYLVAHKFNPKKKFYLYLIAEQYDALDRKKDALKYYQKVFDGIDEKKGMDLLTASIRDFSKSRIDRLKEEIFMER